MHNVERTIRFNREFQQHVENRIKQIIDFEKEKVKEVFYRYVDNNVKALITLKNGNIIDLDIPKELIDSSDKEFEIALEDFKK